MCPWSHLFSTEIALVSVTPSDGRALLPSILLLATISLGTGT